MVGVAFQRRDLVRLTLDSLLAQKHPADEIVVIDNASTDGTPAMPAEEFPTVTQADDEVAKLEALRLLLEAVDRIDDDRLGIVGCRFDPVGDHFAFNGSLWRNRMALQGAWPAGGPPYRTDIMVFRGTLLSLAMIPEIGLPPRALLHHERGVQGLPLGASGRPTQLRAAAAAGPRVRGPAVGHLPSVARVLPGA